MISKMMIGKTSRFLVGSSLMIASLAIFAPQASATDEVYSITQLENGYLRLNTKSGEMSLCAEKNERLVCQAADDERTRFNAEIDRLSKRIDALEAKLTNSKSNGSAGIKPKARSFKEDREEMEKALDLGEFALRRFFDVIQDIEKEAEKKGMNK